MKLEDAHVLVVGIGGLGCPVLSVLSDAGVGRFTLVDDDQIELSNLHRQLLFDEADVGHDKVETAALRLRTHPRRPTVIEERTRLLPDNALSLVREVDLVIEGADNFATKFLAADACRLAEKPIVHGAAVRWVGTTFSVGPRGAPCYRCLFEDLPVGVAQANCAEAGVMAPVAGLCGALMADLALSALSSDDSALGHMYTYDGTLDQLRVVPLHARSSCSLCGLERTILSIDELRYLGRECAA